MCASYTVYPVVSIPARRDTSPMSANPSYADWLRSTRNAARVSQQRLSDLTGIDRGHLSKIENGRIDLPGYETRQRVHAVLGTSEDDLIALGIVRGHAAPLRPVQAVRDERALSTPDPLAGAIARLSPAQRALVSDLVEGLIRLGEIPADDEPAERVGEG